MSALQFGLTPKMRPLPQKRSGLVAALDVGTSKVACLIARLRPREPDDVLRHRTHSIDVLGINGNLYRFGDGMDVCNLRSRYYLNRVLF